MAARIFLALFLLSCLWLEVRSNGFSSRPPQVKPLSQNELALLDEPMGETDGPMSSQAPAFNAQGGSLLQEAVHWVYLAYNDKGESAKTR